MYPKDNRFYADWRDRRGIRKRKAFLTAQDAERYEMEQKAKVRPKTQGTARQSSKSSVPTTPRGSSNETRPAPTRNTLPSASSKSPGKSQLQTSRQPTFRKSSTGGRSTNTARATRVSTASSESFGGSRKSTVRRVSTTSYRSRKLHHRETSRQRRTNGTS
jgi:hypothetical protein